MMKLIVYGSSDDLVEVEGDIREEFNGDEGHLVFSDGTVLKVEYDGIWRFEQVATGKLTTTWHSEVPEDSPRRPEGQAFAGMSTYSEIVVLEGDVEITSVTFGGHWQAAAALVTSEGDAALHRHRMELLDRFEAAGWRIADDGEPYREGT